MEQEYADEQIREMEEILEDIGLTKNQAKLYLSLLELGSSTITEISKHSKIHRTNIYDAIRGAIKKGFVTEIIKGNKRIYEPSSPSFLLIYLQERERQLRMLLPRLLLLEKLRIKANESAAIFTGIQAFQQVRYGLLRHKSEILVYGIPKKALDILGQHRIEPFHKERRKLKIPMKHIYNFEAKERTRYLNMLPYTEARYLPQKFQSSVATYICNNETVLVLWESQPFIIQIISKNIADSYRKFFSLLWKNAYSL